MGEEEEPAVSPTGSSLPPLEDMSKVLRIHAKLSQRDQEGQPIYQVYQVDQRELNVDQRSIHLQQHLQPWPFRCWALSSIGGSLRNESWSYSCGFGRHDWSNRCGCGCESPDIGSGCPSGSHSGCGAGAGSRNGVWTQEFEDNGWIPQGRK